jgi:hypothetical protein
MTVPAPPSGLGSNSNYILYSGCNPLNDLSVSIAVTQDIVGESASGSQTGFAFQLNAYSPMNETSAWQQYIIALWGSAWVPPDWEDLGGTFTSPLAVASWGPNRLDIFGLGTDKQMYHKSWDGTAWAPSYTGWEALGGTFSSPPAVACWGVKRLDIFGLGTDNAVYHKAWTGEQGQLEGMVDNWPMNGPNIINDIFPLTLTPPSTPSTILPAGYKLQISLQNDISGNINKATYVIIDDKGNTQANVTRSLLSESGVTAADLAPIIAFELNLVGPINGESAVLSSGAGTIVYAASVPLTVLSQEPSCAESGYITAETANSVYGVLPAGPSNTFTQTFDVGPEGQMIRKQGKVRPGPVVQLGPAG